MSIFCDCKDYNAVMLFQRDSRTEITDAWNLLHIAQRFYLAHISKTHSFFVGHRKILSFSRIHSAITIIAYRTTIIVDVNLRC